MTEKKESALSKKLKVTAELAEIVGATEISRTETTKAIWAYIKAHNLQDPKNKQTIVPDEKLAKVLGKDPVSMMKMTGLINKHFVK
jgi:chromatin remodeling complex protein RSC6